MKKNLLVVALLLGTVAGALAQGTINFNNRATSGSPSPVVAPIYGVDSADNRPKQGNAASFNGTSGPTPVPAGTQTYGGAPLVGTGFTVAIWGVNSTSSDAALTDSATLPISQGTFRVTTNPALMGFNQPPATSPAVPGVVGGTTDRAKFIIRAWDNKGGTVTTWQQVLQDLSIPHGESAIFTVNAPLGLAPSITPPNMQGFESFQLFTVVPEPSVIALGILGAGCLFVLRRRK